MEKTIYATFDGEVFWPDEKVDLKPNTKVRLTIELLEQQDPKSRFAPRPTGEPDSMAGDSSNK